MSADLTSYLPFILIALVALVIVVWVLTRTGRRARVIADDSGTPLARDVLAEGAAPAPRNQALIDAAPAAVKPEPAPAPPPAPAPAPAPAAAPETADDLTRIKGLGPKLAALLGELGVTSFAQIAAWDDDAIARIDAQLGRFAGRITRDQWVAQARLLAAGDEAGFAAQFGNNG
jgi:predicted flap endonuclease-1-like 5' DNA nuclease